MRFIISCQQRKDRYNIPKGVCFLRVCCEDIRRGEEPGDTHNTHTNRYLRVFIWFVRSGNFLCFRIFSYFSFYLFHYFSLLVYELLQFVSSLLQFVLYHLLISPLFHHKTHTQHNTQRTQHTQHKLHTPHTQHSQRTQEMMLIVEISTVKTLGTHRAKTPAIMRVRVYPCSASLWAILIQIKRL